MDVAFLRRRPSSRPAGVRAVREERYDVLERTDEHAVVKRGEDKPPPQLRAFIPQRPPDGGKVREAVTVVAQAITTEPHRFRAVRSMLRRDPPMIDLALAGPTVDSWSRLP